MIVLARKSPANRVSTLIGIILVEINSSQFGNLCAAGKISVSMVVCIGSPFHSYRLTSFAPPGYLKHTDLHGHGPL